MVAEDFRRTEPPESIVCAVVKSAVAGQIVDDTGAASLKVEYGGNVQVIDFKNGAPNEKLVLPRKEAFELLARGTLKEIEQADRLYHKLLVEAKQWFIRSITVTVTLLVLLLCIVMGLALYIMPERYALVAINVTMAFALISAIIIFLCFRHLRSVHKRVELCCEQLAALQHIYTSIQFVWDLPATDVTRTLLEEALITKLLGPS